MRISRRRLIVASLASAAIPFGTLLAAESCRGGSTNILGPAYRKGAPFRDRLCDLGEPGTPLTMSGIVTDADSCTPLRGAVLDVWQVNRAGDYDMDSPSWHLRGKFKTKQAGTYSFATIMPVPYGVRPKHIHFLVTRDGYEPHITQCYFDGDDRNGHDPFVKKELIIAPTTQGGVLTGTFPIALHRERPADKKAASTYPDYAGIYRIAPGVELTVTARGRRLFWHLNEPENPGDASDGEFAPRTLTRFFVPEYDIEATFVRNEHGAVDHVLDSRGILAKKIG